MAAPIALTRMTAGASVREVRSGRAAQSVRWACWLGGSAATVLLATLPVSTGGQLGLSLATIAAMALIWAFARGKLARTAFIAVASVVVLRYMYWRVTSTLPDVSDPVSFGLAALLLGAELYCAVMLAISLVINADPMERPALIASDGPDLPTVDVFIPTYNEDETILAVTVAAARAMDYPADKLTIWLLDDGGTDQKCQDPDIRKAADARRRKTSLKRLCAELGAVYSTRARNEHAKAGNLNAGLAQSKGEIVVVFDADHAPFRSFLRETVGYFAKDDRLFLVQTPHVFLNPDPIEKNLDTFARMPSENEMFYGVTQRGLDKWNGSFFCGSAALLRRAALTETGGFSGITITEDCESAFELHAKGWTSVFVDKPLIAGLQPETFADFIGQRSRWCQGMFQIMLLKNPALKPGLKLIQRLAYLSSMTFWLFPLPRLAFMLAPLLHIFFDVKIFVANVDESIAYTATYMVVNVMLQNFLYGHVRWPWVSEIYEYVQGMFLSKAIVSVVMSPRKPTFNVTAKGQSLDHDHLSRLAWPFVATFGILAVGVATAAYRYTFEAGVTNLMLVVGLWALFNLVIAAAALGAVAERRQPDRHPRLAIDRTGAVRIGGRSVPARVVSVSASGCAIEIATASAGSLETGDSLRFTLDVGPAEPLEVGLIVSGRDRAGVDSAELGCTFEISGFADYRMVAALMYGDADAISAFLRSRRAHKNILAGTIQLLRWAAIGPVQALSFHLKDRRRAAAVPMTVVEQDGAARDIADVSSDGDIAPVAAVATPAPRQDEIASIVELMPEIAPVVATTTLPGPFASEWLWQMVALAQDELRLNSQGKGEAASGPSPVDPAAESLDDDAWMAALLGLDGSSPSRPVEREYAKEAA